MITVLLSFRGITVLHDDIHIKRCLQEDSPMPLAAEIVFAGVQEPAENLGDKRSAVKQMPDIQALLLAGVELNIKLVRVLYG